MKRLSLSLSVLSLLLAAGLFAAGIVLGQGDSERLFEVYTQIGDLRPQGVQYNPPFDQYVMVNTAGELVIVDAQTYETQHLIYPAGTAVNAYRLSNDGRSLAVAIDIRVEIWDTQTGQKSVEFTPDGALSVQRPLYFSKDDQLLAFEAVIRAPQAIRRSENDTSILPWLWDIAAARRQRSSRLPGGVEAVPFFENRGGVVLGPNDALIAAIVERLRIIKFDEQEQTFTAEVRTGRAEIDPLSIWESLAQDSTGSMYIRRDNDGGITQINTMTGEALDLPIGEHLSLSVLDSIDGLVFNRQTQTIGEPYSRVTTSLSEFLLGEGYGANYQYHPLTVTLIDILRPVTLRPDQFAFLVHVYDEQTGFGELRFIQTDVLDVVLSPDETKLLVRRAEEDQRRLELYDLKTGAFVQSYLPYVRDLSLAHELSFNAAGDQIISDFERIDVETGVVVNQDLRYTSGFTGFYFNDDSTQLTAFRNNEWFLYDVASRQMLRRDTLNIRGSLISTWRSGQRFLSILNSGDGIEIYDIGTGERRQLMFEQIEGRSIIDIIPSPDWQHYFVIYSDKRYNAYQPGNAVAMYSLDQGKLWLIADSDLPSTYSRQYGWVDNTTVYIYSDDTDDGQPERVYGIDYHPSTLPQCLVDTFPDDYTRWSNIWERFNAWLRVDDLNDLALQVCAIVAETDDANAVDALFEPTPRPTDPYYTPTPVVVAGVPVCLTQRFPAQALEYAEDWRRITEALTPAQVDELETLLCESLSGDGSIPEGFSFTPPRVMTIDIATGVRSMGSYIPVRERTSRAAQPIIDAFARVEGRSLNNPVMSPDGQYIGEFTFEGGIIIYRVLKPYDAFIDDVTATVQAQITSQNLIAVRPTETQPFTPIGTAQATLTPTITLTAPPRATRYVDQAERGEIGEFCAADATLYTRDNPPLDWSPGGRLIIPPIKDYTFGEFIVQPTPTGTVPTSVPPTFTPLPPEFPTNTPSNTPKPEDLLPTATPTFSVANMPPVYDRYTSSMWLMSPVDGSVSIGDDVPMCASRLNCQFSFNRQWIWYSDDKGVYLARPDGSEKRTLLDYSLNPVNESGDYRWVNGDTLEYTVSIYERDPEYPSSYTQRLNPNDAGPTPVPTGSYPSFRINQLETQVDTVQPAGGSLAVARTRFNTGSGDGYNYYLYDTAADTTEFFARLYSGSMEFDWHPLGTLLFYRYPDQHEWYVYDTAADEHRIYGERPSGLWSPDARYRVDWYFPPGEEVARRLEAKEPIPKLTLWDSETGLTRRYCIPQTADNGLGGELLWSPDSRYLAFRTVLPAEANLEGAQPRLLVLDIQTGVVMDLGFDTEMPIAWVEGSE